MSGQLPSVTGVYDNAAEFPSDLPTYAHHLRRAGYQTALSGKMHFVGPDQLPRRIEHEAVRVRPIHGAHEQGIDHAGPVGGREHSGRENCDLTFEHLLQVLHRRRRPVRAEVDQVV